MASSIPTMQERRNPGTSRGSRDGSPRQSRAGIDIGPRSSGAANAMPVATGPTLVGTAWQDQGRRRPTPFLAESVRFATTRGWPNTTGVGKRTTRASFSSSCLCDCPSRLSLIPSWIKRKPSALPDLTLLCCYDLIFADSSLVHI